LHLVSESLAFDHFIHTPGLLLGYILFKEYLNANGWVMIIRQEALMDLILGNDIPIDMQRFDDLRKPTGERPTNSEAMPIDSEELEDRHYSSRISQTIAHDPPQR
jgi:hypothetical protein